MNPVISADKLTKKYHDRLAVDHVSFDVREGEIFGFLGPNGAGKTTTMRMLTTLASITEGEATVAGYDLRTEASAVRRNIGVVLQEVTLDNELKGIENLTLSAKLHHIQECASRVIANELLELVELEGVAEKRVGVYSSGMKKRLQLITALIHKPRVLFLDEPTVGLDIQTRSKMWDYLQRLCKDYGLTIFLTTHYLEEADFLCDKIAIMDRGVIKVLGSPGELKRNLNGDVLALEIPSGEDLTAFFEKSGQVISVTRVGSTYRMKLPNKVESALPAIVKEISERGLKIQEMSFAKPTLDQVFLEITGRSLRDAEKYLAAAK